jgi:hypothetical protein
MEETTQTITTGGGVLSPVVPNIGPVISNIVETGKESKLTIAQAVAQAKRELKKLKKKGFRIESRKHKQTWLGHRCRELMEIDNLETNS